MEQTDKVLHILTAAMIHANKEYLRCIGKDDRNGASYYKGRYEAYKSSINVLKIHINGKAK